MFPNNLWKFRHNRMNTVCSCRATPGTPASTILCLFLFLISKTTASMFTTTFESYIAIGWTVCAPARQHRILQLVQFLISKTTVSMFPITYESFIAVGWTTRALVGKVQHRVLQHFSFFFISKTTASMFATTCESFIEIGWTVCAPIQDRQTHTHTDT